MTMSYFMLRPQDIVEDIVKKGQKRQVTIQNVPFIVCPHVYPSDQFRSSQFILQAIAPIAKNRVVCDMGCGMGVIGHFALRYGASRVVQADVNPYAVENARANKQLYSIEDRAMQVHLSDCFDQVPTEKFDLIVFNIPFHCEPFVFSDPLERAFHDPGFKSVQKFLMQAPAFCHERSEILIVFSNKGDVAALEKIFENSQFHAELWKVTNIDQAFDTRIYRLRLNS